MAGPIPPATMVQVKKALRALESRIQLFVALPIDKLDHLTVKVEVDAIGRICSDMGVR